MKRNINRRKGSHSIQGMVNYSEIIKSLIFEINDPLIVALSSKTKTRNEIAGEYGITVKVLNKWLLEKCLSIPQGLICPADLRIIYAAIGPPHAKTVNKDP